MSVHVWVFAYAEIYIDTVGNVVEKVESEGEESCLLVLADWLLVEYFGGC